LKMYGRPSKKLGSNSLMKTAGGREYAFARPKASRRYRHSAHTKGSKPSSKSVVFGINRHGGAKPRCRRGFNRLVVGNVAAGTAGF
jgi:hypothetical protein